MMTRLRLASMGVGLQQKSGRRSIVSQPGLLLLLGLMLLAVAPTRAAFINFQNCLPTSQINGAPPKLLQFDPLNVTAAIDLVNPGHNLNITVYGNVSGQASVGVLPPPSNTSHWDNRTETFGKIIDKDPQTDIYSTLFVRYSVLSWVAFNSGRGEQFCSALAANRSCPIGPVFDPAVTPQDLSALPAINYVHPMQSTYGFTTILGTISAEQGDKEASPLTCISFKVTPYIGQVVESLLTYLPFMILVLIAIATVTAAIFSPWGTWDVFRATSNYGREVRLLRMMTPGFGDCLNYLQFIVLTGSLSLSYPGFFQPAVSSVAWSALMFNESFVSHGPGRPAVVDGIYVANGTYGLDIMSQLVGMSSDQDLWAGMMVWLLTAIGGIILLIQVAFALRWLYRRVSRTQQEDLRAKNGPFSTGNAIRIVFNYFMVPITAFSMFQLVIAASAPTPGTVAIAALTLLILLAFIGWLIWVIIDARPRSFLFDDLPTVLTYGPLYNTYSDHAAPFAAVTIFINFLRGVAIGAVQPSGIAQIVLLAICEVIFMLTLNAFRPFFSGTYMNLINTIFSVVRLIVILLMVVFVPSLEAEISDASKGYVAYIILIIHALVLFTGFFVRVLSTLFELTARAAGAGEDTSAIGGFARVLGLRQLARRDAREAARSRQSYASNATMLNHTGVEKSAPSGTRSRSMSATSGLLLNNGRQSVALESVSAYGGQSQHGSGKPPSTANGAGSIISRGQVASLGALRSMEPSDPYFRTPRGRRVTMELPEIEPRDAGSRKSWGSGDWAKAAASVEGAQGIEMAEGPSVSGRGTPIGLGGTRERTDSVDDRGPKPDYATREVDYYYGVRGPALSHMPTRRLKTGPADPTGPVSSAAGWFKDLFGNKTKEKGKGFEVVRSARAPPQLQEEEKAIEAGAEPYVDDPQASGRPRHFELDDEGDAVGGGTRHLPGEEVRGDYSVLDGEGFPRLPEIDAGDSLHMPSRWGSRTSANKPSRGPSKRAPADPPVPEVPLDLYPVPDVPRKSSKRNSVVTGSNHGSTENVGAGTMHAPTVAVTGTWPLGPSPLGPSPAGSSSHLPAQRLPFGDSLAPKAPHHMRTLSGGSDISAVSAVSRTSDVSAMTAEAEPPAHLTQDARARSALGGADRAPRLGSALRDERPSSMGYVQQHRASDGIRVVQQGDHSLTGSSAELVDDGR